MEFPIYLFSNTWHLDFHELSIPQDERLLNGIRRFLSSPPLRQKRDCHYPIILFGKREGDMLFIGAELEADILNELDERYYRVARCKGKTPTIATLVFGVPLSCKPPIISTYRIAKVLEEIYGRAWYAERESPEHLFVSAEDEYIPLKRRSIWGRRSYRDKEKLFLEFNVAIQKAENRKSFETFFVLKERSCDQLKRYRNRKIEIIKKGVEKC